MTKEEKEYKKRLFCQYFGQEFQTPNSSGQINWKLLRHWVDYCQKAYIPLTPLSAITDEHALQVGKIIFNLNYTPDITRDSTGVWIDITDEDYVLFEKDGSIEVQPVMESISQYGGVFDFLRKNGYALPYDGKSVEEQVKLGYIKT